MLEQPELLKLRVLLCFLNSDIEDCTVTNIARTLNKEKYIISRAMAALEKEGYLDRGNPRKPVLTKSGHQAAVRYNERLQVSLNHLLYEGVDIDSAKQDALSWALYCTDQTMDVVRSSENRYRVKYELRGQKQSRGSTVCRLLRDGVYQVPFVLYSEQVQNGTNISMANSAFEHPCILSVENGIGTIHLRTIPISKSFTNGEQVNVKIQSLKYFVDGRFVVAENSGDIFSFPAEALSFLNFGQGVGRILHGSVCLLIDRYSGTRHPAKQAIFTILL